MSGLTISGGSIDHKKRIEEKPSMEFFISGTSASLHGVASPKNHRLSATSRSLTTTKSSSRQLTLITRQTIETEFPSSFFFSSLMSESGCHIWRCLLRDFCISSCDLKEYSFGRASHCLQPIASNTRRLLRSTHPAASGDNSNILTPSNEN